MNVLQQLCVLVFLELGIPISDLLWELPGWKQAQRQVLIREDLLNPVAEDWEEVEIGYSFENWQHYYHMCKGLPRSEGVRSFLKFVSPDLVEQQCSFNLSCASRLKALAELHPHDAPWTWEIVSKLNRLRSPWDTLDSALRSRHSACRYWMRMHLEDLKTELGPEAYFLGELPPIVPLEHWRYIP